jgi:hypothetical protein
MGKMTLSDAAEPFDVEPFDAEAETPEDDPQEREQSAATGDVSSDFTSEAGHTALTRGSLKEAKSRRPPLERRALEPRRQYLNPQRTALYIETFWGVTCSPGKLAKARCAGDGPAFRLLGSHPVYCAEDIDEWAEAHLGPKVHSTAAYTPDDPAWRKRRGGRPRKPTFTPLATSAE